MVLPESYEVIGFEGHKPTLIHHGRGVAKDKFVCLWVPKKYHQVRVATATRKITLFQTKEIAIDVARGADSVKLPRSKNVGGKASASMSFAILSYSPFVRLLAA